MIIPIEQLNWNQRFAVINHFKLTDEEVCTVFNIVRGELNGARDVQRKSGYLQPDPMLNCEQYKPLVDLIRKPFFKTEEAKEGTTEKAKKKPGRNTRKIKDAYEAIPYNKIPVEEFMKAHDISLSVLRRHKQYDHRPELGKVNVRKFQRPGDEEKVLCIWRDSPE